MAALGYNNRVEQCDRHPTAHKAENVYYLILHRESLPTAGTDQWGIPYLNGYSIMNQATLKGLVIVWLTLNKNNNNNKSNSGTTLILVSQLMKYTNCYFFYLL